MRKLACVMMLTAGVMWAQTPVVTEVVNNFSRGFAIAPGSIFIVKGTNLSDRSTGLQSAPLATTLEGVRIRISRGGVTHYAPLYYVTPDQLAGIWPSGVLPPSTPSPTTVVVENNGRLSALKSYTPVDHSFGTLVYDVNTGMGKAIAQDLSYRLLSDTNAANPGQVIILYGSGLGPVRAGVDETQEQTGPNASGNMTDVPMVVSIGGKPANTLYRGRTIFPGLDQINVVVPQLDPAAYGCDVPLLVMIGTQVSNGTTLPVAAGGSLCQPHQVSNTPRTDPKPTPAEIQSWSERGNYVIGEIQMVRGRTYLPANAHLLGIANGISASFIRWGGEDAFRRLREELPPGKTAPRPGQCVDFVPDQLTMTTFNNVTVSAADAGLSFNVFGPNGVRVVPKGSNGFSLPSRAGDLPRTGQYSIVSLGGVDVAPFAGTLQVAQDFVITNSPTEFEAIDRSKPLTIRWTGGETEGTFTIYLGGAEGGGTIHCVVEYAAGEFSIPASLLAQIQPNSRNGSLSVTANGRGTRIPAPAGVDILTLNNTWLWIFAPVFQ